MGYHLHSLLLFKFEIKQNVSNTNTVRNKIINGFKIISMVKSMIRGNDVNFREN